MDATIKDVAKKAGVSIATVSRVLNNSDLVLEETKALVRKVARELYYTPNHSARSLSTTRTNTICLLLPDLYGEFFSEVIRGADLTARQYHYHLLVSSSHNNKKDIEAALHAMRGRVDGLIIMSPHIDAHTLNSNLPLNLPVVLLNCYLHGESFDALNIDNFNGTYHIVRHLIEHGHSRIAIIKGTEKNIDAQERLRGYRAALEEANVQRSHQYELPGDFTEASGYEAVEKLLQLHPRPTAIFASNDSLAIGALSALRTLGINIPQDMALVGFDDIPVAQYLKPALTSVHIGISDLGVSAVRTLIDAVKEKNTHEKQQVIVPTVLVARESCGCKC